MNINPGHFFFHLVTLGLFISSLCLPVAYARGPHLGIEALFVGWAVDQMATMSWLANPLFIASFICFLFPKQRKASFYLASGALGLAMFSFLIEDVYVSEAPQIAAFELRYGALFWFGSLLLLFTNTFIQYWSNRRL